MQTDMNERQQYERADDEITLKEIIFKVGDFLKAIQKKWWWLLLAGLVMAALFLARAWFTKPIYSADMTFTIANSEKGGGGAVSGLLGQFGLGGMGGGGGGLNTTRVLELSKSMEIIGSVLFMEAEIEKENDLIANHVIRIYELREEWSKDNEQLKDFAFTHGKVDSFSRTENSIYKNLFRKICNGDEAFLSINYEELSGIFSMEMATISEELSLELLEKEYEILSQYYINQTIEPQLNRYAAIKVRLDSLTNVLQGLDYSVARFQDRSYGLFEQTSSVEGQRLRREQQLANIAYAEIKKNLEIADFALSSVKPVFQTIDEAIEPLNKQKPSLIQAAIIGTILGIFVMIIFIIVLKIIQDAIHES